MLFCPSGGFYIIITVDRLFAPGGVGRMPTAMATLHADKGGATVLLFKLWDSIPPPKGQHKKEYLQKQLFQRISSLYFLPNMSVFSTVHLRSYTPNRHRTW